MKLLAFAALCMHLHLLTAVSSVRLPPDYSTNVSRKQIPTAAGAKELDFFPVEESDWVRTQATYAAQIASRIAHNEPLDLAVFGDSITESFRGTLQGRPHINSSGMPAIWEKHFGSWQALPLGIAGDRTVNLLWRIKEGGEAPEELSVRSAVVQIGTNNFYNHYEQKYGEVPMSETDAIVEEICAGILASVIALHRQWPKTHLVLLGILPRSDVEPGIPNPDHHHFNWPSMFTPAVTQINKELEDFCLQQRYVSFVDCGHLFIVKNSEDSQLNTKLISDGLHPTAAGMDVLLDCLKPHLQPPAHHRKLDLMDTS